MSACAWMANSICAMRPASRNTPAVRSDKTRMRARIVQAMGDRTEYTIEQIAQRSGVHRRVVYRHVAQMVEEGAAVQAVPTFGRRAARYARVDR